MDYRTLITLLFVENHQYSEYWYSITHLQVFPTLPKSTVKIILHPPSI